MLMQVKTLRWADSINTISDKFGRFNQSFTLTSEFVVSAKNCVSRRTGKQIHSIREFENQRLKNLH